MKNLFAVVFSFVVVLFSSCEKEEIQKITTPEKLPVLIKYNVADALAILLNDIDSTTKIVGFDGKYSIKFEYRYDETYPLSFGYAFAQNDTGSICIAYGQKKYAVILAEEYFSDYRLFFKFDVGYDDLIIFPEILTDTCQTFSVINKKNNREMKINTFAFLSQGSCVLYYD
jgi:hypothetical protein